MWMGKSNLQEWVRSYFITGRGFTPTLQTATKDAHSHTSLAFPSPWKTPCVLDKWCLQCVSPELNLHMLMKTEIDCSSTPWSWNQQKKTAFSFLTTPQGLYFTQQEKHHQIVFLTMWETLSECSTNFICLKFAFTLDFVLVPLNYDF